MSAPSLFALDLGLAPYPPVQVLQRRLLEHVASGRLPGVVLLLEHPPVITLGRRGSPDDLVTPAAPAGPSTAPADKIPLPSESRTDGESVVPVMESERGGRATFHMPGQLVSYPVMPIPGKDLGRYVFALEEVLVRLLMDYGVAAERSPGRPGLYVGDLKIASLGLRCRSWVASHGTSVNICPDLSLFRFIISCGEPGLRQTSVQALTGEAPSMPTVKEHYLRHFRDVFGRALEPVRAVSYGSVEQALGLTA